MSNFNDDACIEHGLIKVEMSPLQQTAAKKEPWVAPSVADFDVTKLTLTGDSAFNHGDGNTYS